MFSLKDLGIKDGKDYTFFVFSDLNSTDKPDDSSDDREISDKP